MDLWLQLQNLNKNNLSASDYTLTTNTFTNHLTSTGDHVPYHNLIIFIVGGLCYNSNYNAFVIGINMKESKLIVNALTSMLESYDRM